MATFLEWLEDILDIPYDRLRLVVRKCPNCEKMMALRKTGKTRFVGEAQDTVAPTLGDKFFDYVFKRSTGSTMEWPGEEEWVCEYCGHRFWKEISKSSV